MEKPCIYTSDMLLYLAAQAGTLRERSSQPSPKHNSQRGCRRARGQGGYPSSSGKEIQPTSPTVSIATSKDIAERAKLPADRSVEFWNDAYDHLEAGEETVTIVNAYKETLAEILTDEKLEQLEETKLATHSSAPKDQEGRTGGERRHGVSRLWKGRTEENPAVREDIKVEMLKGLNDRTSRPDYMARFVRDGKSKVAKASKRMEQVSAIAETVLAA